MPIIQPVYLIERNDWIAVLWVIFAHAIGVGVIIFGQNTLITNHTTKELPIILLNTLSPKPVTPTSIIRPDQLSAPINPAKLNKIKHINKILSKPVVLKPSIPKPAVHTPLLKSNISNPVTHTVKPKLVTSPTINRSPALIESIKPISASPIISENPKHLQDLQTKQLIETSPNSVKTADTSPEKISTETLPNTNRTDTMPLKNVSENTNGTDTITKSGSSKQSTSTQNSDDANDQINGQTGQSKIKTSAIFNADYLNNPAPIYPNISRLRGETGKVLLRVQVNRQGRASRVEVYRSSGSKPLDEAAIRAVNYWNFVPAKVDGNPINSTVIVPIEFKLD